jgi:general secretion pathway protein G
VSARLGPGGFTLVEMLVTAAIVALLASAAIPFAQMGVHRGKEQELRAALREIRTAIDAYHQAVVEGRIAAPAGSAGYPPSLEALVDGVPDATSAEQRRRLYFLRRIPRDPFAPDPAQDVAAAWALRSYASSADEPREGEDVYDVSSRAPGIGLNGIAYARW